MAQRGRVLEVGSRPVHSESQLGAERQAMADAVGAREWQLGRLESSAAQASPRPEEQLQAPPEGPTRGGGSLRPVPEAGETCDQRAAAWSGCGESTEILRSFLTRTCTSPSHNLSTNAFRVRGTALPPRPSISAHHELPHQPSCLFPFFDIPFTSASSKHCYRLASCLPTLSFPPHLGLRLR